MDERTAILFEWNYKKAEENYQKHGVSFETATKVFLDDERLEIFDQEHSSQAEYRYIVIGYADDILYVVYTERSEKIRLISARRATLMERNLYRDYSVYIRSKRKDNR